jgi:hypothetical protein
MSPVGEAPIEPAGALRRSPAVSRRARAVTALTAAWAWSLVVLFPGLEVGPGSLAAALAGLAFPLVVGTGLALDALGPATLSGLGARGLLLLSPVALVAPLALRDDLARHEVLGPLAQTVMVVAAAAYLGAAAWLAGTHEPLRAAQSTALPPSALAPSGGWARAVRRTFVALSAVGALLLVTLAPGWGGHALRLARHGIDGAEVGAVLATVVGLAAGVTLLGAAVAPALRARATTPAALTSTRVPLWLALATLALGAWGLLRHLGG